MSTKVTRCSRCTRRLRNDAACEWNVTVQAGRVVDVTCPTCQTPEEYVEAEIKLATLDYLGFDGLGRMLVRPKVGADDTAA